MLRRIGCSLIVLCGFAASASAANLMLDPRFAEQDEFSLTLLDPSFQQAVIAAAPSDWRETPGTDVWWLSYDGLAIQIKVFPTLERPGRGRPNCCVHFVLDDTEFWLKLQSVVPGVGIDVGAGGNSAPSIPPAVGSPWDVLPGGNGPSGTTDSLASGPSSTPSAVTAADEAGGADVVIAQVPEPALLLLLGLGALAVRRGEPAAPRV